MQHIDFAPLEIGHRSVFDSFFLDDPPGISELTFTNLFMWRHRYNTVWAEHRDCLLIILRPEGGAPFGLQPVGPGDKDEALAGLCGKLGGTTPDVRICRVNEEFAFSHADPGKYDRALDRDNSDYVYLSEDLINLSGRRFHKKKNLLNRFMKNSEFQYRELDHELVECFLDMQKNWCQIRDCNEKPDLLAEDYAIYQALTHFEELDYKGGAIQIDTRLEAISLGERLGEDTAVIHIEKANPDIPGLYAAMNQLFCLNAWSDTTYINREQDLGIEGLRRAKESYNPHHMVNKYTLTPR
jgi:hypothetical protein